MYENMTYFFLLCLILQQNEREFKFTFEDTVYRNINETAQIFCSFNNISAIRWKVTEYSIYYKMIESMGECLVSSSHNLWVMVLAVHWEGKHWKVDNFQKENYGFGHEHEF